MWRVAYKARWLPPRPVQCSLYQNSAADLTEAVEAAGSGEHGAATLELVLLPEEAAKLHAAFNHP